MTARLMSDDLQVDSNQPDKVGDSQPGAEIPVANYHVVPFNEQPGDQELYSFREAMTEPEPAEGSKPEPAKRKQLPALLLIGLAVVLGSLAILLIPKVTKPSKAPALYVDLGARQFDPAGLSGRLIVRWEGSAAYQLYVDPSDQGETAEFEAVAVDPPHALSVSIHLHDSSGKIVCQKKS